MNHLTSTQQILLNRAMFGVGLGCLFIRSHLHLTFRQFINDGAGNHLPKYQNKQEWIREGIHHFLIEVKKELRWYRKTPDVQKIELCVETALRLTGSKLRMTETEVQSLFETI